MREPLKVTPYSLAFRFHGMKEVQGATHNPAIVAMLQLDGAKFTTDETPWCSGFANYIAWLAGCARSRSLMARSWLRVGTQVDPDSAVRGFHVVVLSRGGGFQPGPHVFDAPGHVGFFHGWDDAGRVLVLGGNQSNAVNVVGFPKAQILGVREI